MDQPFIAKNRVGRPKGSKNNASKILEQAQKEIEEKFGIINFHPITALLAIGADPRNDMSIRLSALGKASPYILPTLKAVELTGADGGPVQLMDVTEDDAETAKLLGLEVAAIASEVEDTAEDEDAEEVIDEEREAIAAAKRAELEIEAEQSEADRAAAREAQRKARVRKPENLDDLDGLLDLGV